MFTAEAIWWQKMEHHTTIGDTTFPRRAPSLLMLGLLLWGCAAEPTLRMESDAARRRVDLVVRDAQAEVSSLRQEVAVARIAAAKKDAELQDLRRQVAELQRTAEAKQGELATLRTDRDRLLQTKNDLEHQVAELPRLRQSVAEVMETQTKVAETQSKLRELETTLAVLTADLAQVKRDLARGKGKAGGRGGKPAAANPMPEASIRPVAAVEALMPSDRRPRLITVERGDTLGLIAKLYGVNVAGLMDANGLRSDLILIGQELVIPRVPPMGQQARGNGQ